jgi:galactose-1-phosphate uridylyltransferase
MTLEFSAQTQTTTFHSPLEDFEPVTVEVEVRDDPLTDRHARIVPDNFLTPEAEPDIDPVVSDDEGCFFCPEMVSNATPTYVEDLSIGVDRGSRGEATSFPNLNPYGSHSNVVVLTEDHYVPIDEFTPEQFADGLALALEYVTAAMASDEGARFASINMNFLRPAGSSIVHPHVQTLVDGRGTNRQAARTVAARAYLESEGSTYWSDLLDAERDGDRHVGTTGDVTWLAPFAPKHHRHVRGVLPGSEIPGADDDVVADVAEGLTNVLAAYGDLGLNSFNVAFSLVADEPGSHPTIDVVARSVFDQYYWSDSPFFPILHDEGVVDVAPEEYAATIGEHF